MQGVLAGYFVGGIPFGIAGVLVAYRIIDRLGDRPARSPEDTRPAMAGGPGSGGDDSVLGK